MPNFVWIAKDKSGKTVLREIFADTAEQSRDQLISEGCTELELRGDEVWDAAKEGFTDKPKFFGETLQPTPEQKLEALEKPRNTYWLAIKQGVLQTKGFCAFMLCLGLFELWRGHPVSALLIGLGLFAWLVFLVTVALPSIYYAKLIKAGDWYRWADVLEQLEKCELIGKFHFINLPAVELVRWRAKALAGQGRLPEAVALFQSCENQPGCPSWLHKSHLASIYTIAKQYDKALEYSRLSIAEKPTAAGYLDLANRLARFKKDPVGARAGLVEADKETITELAKPYRHRCCGIVALLEGDYTNARQELETSIATMDRTRHLPGRDGNIAVAKAYLACVLARLGDLPAAQNAFAEAKEYLVATKETELLADCNKALGE